MAQCSRHQAPIDLIGFDLEDYFLHECIVLNDDEGCNWLMGLRQHGRTPLAQAGNLTSLPEVT